MQIVAARRIPKPDLEKFSRSAWRTGKVHRKTALNRADAAADQGLRGIEK